MQAAEKLILSIFNRSGGRVGHLAIWKAVWNRLTRVKVLVGWALLALSVGGVGCVFSTFAESTIRKRVIFSVVP